MELLRRGEVLKKSVVLAERPGEAEGEGGEDEGEQESGIEWLGIRYQELIPSLKAMHRIPEDVHGVWITDISPRSPLYDAGVRVENVVSIIVEVNGEEILGVEDLERVVGGARSGSRLRLYVRRFGNGREVQPLFAFPAKP
jgi:hypothetical protein